MKKNRAFGCWRISVTLLELLFLNLVRMAILSTSQRIVEKAEREPIQRYSCLLGNFLVSFLLKNEI